MDRHTQAYCHEVHSEETFKLAELLIEQFPTIKRHFVNGHILTVACQILTKFNSCFKRSL